MTTNIPKKYKAAVYDTPGKVSTKVVELDTPEPGYGQVLIRLTHSGVCHSDFGVMTNSWAILRRPTETNQIGGHEGESFLPSFPYLDPDIDGNLLLTKNQCLKRCRRSRQAWTGSRQVECQDRSKSRYKMDSRNLLLVPGLSIGP